MPPPHSSDELYAYLTHCRPDLCILEGVEEDSEANRDEEEFVLIEDKQGEEEDEGEEDEEEEAFQRHRSSGDDWEVRRQKMSCQAPKSSGTNWLSVFGFVTECIDVSMQMVLMEESGDKLTPAIDRDPEGLNNIVASSHILEASDVREVSDAQNN